MPDRTGTFQGFTVNMTTWVRVTAALLPELVAGAIAVTVT
jgi:hypothetical protein